MKKINSKLFHVKHFQDAQQEQLFLDFLKAQNLELPESSIGLLFQYAECVLKGNEFTNLISKNDAGKFLTRHIADSLMPYINMEKILGESLQSFIAKKNGNVKWADMGAGGGCPVFPLAIAMPEIQFYAVEPRNKRVQFMQQTKEALGLKNLEVVGKRFETAGLINLDFISCRALSTFENDWERAKFNLKRGGCFVTLKSLETIAHLASDPLVHITEYKLPLEERQYALVHKFF